MNYLKIENEDVCNGTGLRVVLWLSGCSHHCYNCQNPQTWDPNNGIPFDESAKQEIFNELSKDYISGITFSGGDPLHGNNLDEVLKLVKQIRNSFPDKTIWLYTGYKIEDIFYPYIINQPMTCEQRKRIGVIRYVDILVDGEYIDEQKDLSLKFRGSKNQRVIDVQQTLKQGKVVLYCE